jgi:hypothetical protein
MFESCIPSCCLTLQSCSASCCAIKRLRMLLVTKKNLKLFWKHFYSLTHFTQLKSALVNHELRTVSQYFIIAVCWFKILCALCKNFWIVFKFSLVTLCKYFIDCIVWTDHISLYKLDLLLMYHNHKLLSYVSYCQDSFCAMLLYNDKFYIHSDGSLE